jgi:hypothetical protein
MYAAHWIKTVVNVSKFGHMGGLGSHSSDYEHYCVWHMMPLSLVEVYWHFRGHTGSIITADN